MDIELYNFSCWVSYSEKPHIIKLLGPLAQATLYVLGNRLLNLSRWMLILITSYFSFGLAVKIVPRIVFILRLRDGYCPIVTVQSISNSPGSQIQCFCRTGIRNTGNNRSTVVLIRDLHPYVQRQCLFQAIRTCSQQWKISLLAVVTLYSCIKEYLLYQLPTYYY